MASVTTIQDSWFSSSTNKRLKKVRVQTVVTGTPFVVSAADVGLQKIYGVSNTTDGSNNTYLLTPSSDGNSVVMAKAASPAGSYWAASADNLSATFVYTAEGI